MNESEPSPSLDERRLELDRERLRLDTSFARKWLPTVATVVVAFVAGVFGYVQHLTTTAATERAQHDADLRDEREWGFKVIEWYFDNRGLFDLTQNPDRAEANLRVLAVVAPKVVQGVLDAEKARIPAPGAQGAGHEGQRLESLAAAAGIQSAIDRVEGETPEVEGALKPSDFVVYIQYAEGSRAVALRVQEAVIGLGYRAPGIDRVESVPSRLQVRYYRPEQQALAESLAAKLGDLLELEGTAVQLKSEKQLPSGILEVWLPEEPAR